MIALVTGASSGIGKAMLPLFAQDRHDLVLVARRGELLDAQKRELEQRYQREGVRVWTIALDLAQPGAAAQLFARTRALGLDVDILVNNAGFALYGEFHEQPLGRLSEMIDLNVGALTELTHLYLQSMKQRGLGRILQVASTAAFQPGPRLAVYYASKAYVLSFSEALACELKGSGVTVTALCPGPTASEFNQVANFHMPAALASSVMSSDQVARIGYREMMKGKRVAVAGVANRLLTIGSQLAPRGLVLAVADKLMRSRS